LADHSVYQIGHAPIALTIFVIVAIAGRHGRLHGAARIRCSRVGFACKAPCAWLLVLPSAIAVVEWFRGWFLSGFPWLALGYTQTDAPLAGFAPLGGVYAVTFRVTLSAGALVALLFGKLSRTASLQRAPARVWILGFALWDTSGRSRRRAGDGRDRAGAVPQEMKWDQEQFEATLELYRDLTAPHLGAKIIVWPESALAAPVHMLGGFLGPEWDATKRAARRWCSGSCVAIRVARSTTTRCSRSATSRSGTRSAGSCRSRSSFPCRSGCADWLKGMDLPYSGFERAAIRSRRSMRWPEARRHDLLRRRYASDQLAC
jgi:apolipoprotein N-acyltransferase